MYMATSRGIFELKYFFTSSIAAADGGEAHSAEAVRHRIRQLIEAESDEERYGQVTEVKANPALPHQRVNQEQGNKTDAEIFG